MTLKKTFKVLNMNCNHCVANITKALKNLDGVDDISFNLKKKEVTIVGEILPKAVIDTIENAGYQVDK